MGLHCALYYSLCFRPIKFLCCKRNAVCQSTKNAHFFPENKKAPFRINHAEQSFSTDVLLIPGQNMYQTLGNGCAKHQANPRFNQRIAGHQQPDGTCHRIRTQ